MYTKTDIVLLCLFLFFLLNGWRRGFLRTILAPLCLLICTVIGVFIYDLTHNIVKAAAFVSVGTLVATLLAHILLGMAKRTVDPNYRDYCIWYSRLLGSLFGLAWEGGITVLIVISLTLAPMKLYGIEKVQDDVQRSFAFSLMEKKV
ncbi:MAG: CvpA family protein, partial [Candidatus Omnitrophota bacterium]|nr:CvpA family protein [Candidatus Omnitrophota bacterium]